MDWKKTLGQLAPTIGAAFGPLGLAGGIAVKELLGIPGTTDEQLASFLQTPEGQLKAKQAEYDYNIHMKRLEVKSDRLDVEDTIDARKRDVENRKNGYKNIRADVMLIIVGIGLVVDVILIAVIKDMKPEVLAIFNMLIGASIKMLGDAFHFEFGSSRGSKEKDYRI